MKELRFVGTSLADLSRFPTEAKRAVGFDLWQIQNGLEPSDWKPMNGVGAGVREIRVRAGGAWRVLYVAKFAEAVYVLHAFGKKTPRTAQSDLDLAAKRYAEVAQR
jgi:phage-related protein